MNGLWKESVSGWNHKDQRRKKQTRKNTLRDKSLAILQDSYNDRNKITKVENAQTITYTGSRWGRLFPLPKTVNIKKISFRIPLKNDEYDVKKGSYVTIKAYYKGSEYNGEWLEASTNENIRDFFNLGMLQRINIYDIFESEETYGKKILDWTDEIEKRKKIIVRDFLTTQNEFVYDKPFPKWLKWTMYTESSRRKWAHKFTTGQTRASIRDWISEGDWDAERQIPYGEISYAWIVN